MLPFPFGETLPGGPLFPPQVVSGELAQVPTVTALMTPVYIGFPPAPSHFSNPCLTLTLPK